MARFNCQVTAVDRLSPSLYRIALKSEHFPAFRAGQYLRLCLDEQEQPAFSIASTPLQSDYLELHIDIATASAAAAAKNRTIIAHILRCEYLTVDMPHGTAWLQDEQHSPLLLIAGGSGFSYIRAILLTALATQPQRPLHLYWGGRAPHHLYELRALQALNVLHSQLTVVPVVEKSVEQQPVEQSMAQWQGRQGTVINAVMQDFTTLAHHHIHLAGPLAMIRCASEHLCQQRGARRQHLYSDAFSRI